MNWESFWSSMFFFLGSIGLVFDYIRREVLLKGWGEMKPNKGEGKITGMDGWMDGWDEIGMEWMGCWLAYFKWGLFWFFKGGTVEEVMVVVAGGFFLWQLNVGKFFISTFVAMC
ncbi:hypothetical protein QBC40DRAFT_5651 [Triangularia verruculosa]|uniref:Uncharacterized protein n=1 Tax=Triangularia verruculosa TaxID=2587418 RepID=A0AAN7ASA9_9PEZI|nr:hypothetical protein QBC40DRAFT_5651 [Triangularia verruculosa]